MNVGCSSWGEGYACGVRQVHFPPWLPPGAELRVVTNAGGVIELLRGAVGTGLMFSGKDQSVAS